MADAIEQAATPRLARALWLLGLSPPSSATWPALWRALLAVGHVPVADALLDGDHRAGVLDADAL